MVPILFTEHNSSYLRLRTGRSPLCDCYDIKRDALMFPGGTAAVYHPPCRLWSRLRQFSTADESEKYLAIWAVRMVRLHSGVLEHPAGSSLWPCCNIPKPGTSDEYGFCIEVDQYHWGHPCRKRTWLYICGISPDASVLQYRRIPGSAKYVINPNRGNAANAIPKEKRNATPIRFAKWLVKICAQINNSA